MRALLNAIGLTLHSAPDEALLLVFIHTQGSLDDVPSNDPLYSNSPGALLAGTVNESFLVLHPRRGILVKGICAPLTYGNTPPDDEWLGIIAAWLIIFGCRNHLVTVGNVTHTTFAAWTHPPPPSGPRDGPSSSTPWCLGRQA